MPFTFLVAYFKYAGTISTIKVTFGRVWNSRSDKDDWAAYTFTVALVSTLGRRYPKLYQATIP